MINSRHFMILFLLTSFASFNAVLFTPAMPSMVKLFGVSGGTIQQVVLFYLLGYSIGQLFYGPIANRYGRKPTLYGGILLEIFSSALCIVAIKLKSIHLLFIARFFLAMGAGSGLVIAYAMINETFAHAQAMKRISYLTLSFAVSPGVSVFIGSVLLAKHGIVGCFNASFVYGLILLAATLSLPETLKTKHYDALKISVLFKNYKTQFKNLKVVMPGIIMGANASYIYIFASTAPFIAMLKFKLDPIAYGSYNMLPPIGLVLGSVLSANIAAKFKPKQLICYGLILIFIGISCMALVNSVFVSGVLVSLFLPIIIVYFGSSLIHPSAIIFGMNHSDNKANASAILNFLNLGIVTIADVFLMYCKINFSTLFVAYIILFSAELIIYYLVIVRDDQT